MRYFLPIITLAVLHPAVAAAQEIPNRPVAAPRVVSPSVRPYAQLVPAPEVGNRSTYSFQVSLLLADTQGGAEYEGLSKNAQKALEDLRDFLPFRSYRLLDFAWLRTSSRSSAKIQGPDGRHYELSLHLGGQLFEDSGKLFISSFDLVDASRHDEDLEGASMIRRRRSLISTSFGMQEGETVVVGTSRLEGDRRALVVLLTAVPTSLSGG